MAANVKGPPLVTARTSGLSSFKQNAETLCTTSDSTSKQSVAAPKSWHDVLEIHPAAAEFDLMSHDELVALGEDIKARGLVNPIVYTWAEDAGPNVTSCRLLDGRSRLDAMEAVGLEVELKVDCGGRLLMSVAGLREGANYVPEPIRCTGDPYNEVTSLNIHRRHLTPERKHERLAKLFKLKPELSARQAAKLVGASPTTASETRKKLVEQGDVSNLDTSVDTKGRRQPRSKRAMRAQVLGGRPRSPRPGIGRQPAVAPLNSLAWSPASAEEKKRFLSAIGFDDWWNCAPGEFREKASNAGNTIEVDVRQASSEVRTVKLSTPLVSAGEEHRAAADPMAIPTALKRTPATDRFGRPRPEPGSLLKPEKKRGRR